MTQRYRASGQRPFIDLVEFARTEGVLEGAVAPPQFARLRELLAGDAGEIAWRLTGERRRRPDGGADAFLSLEFEGGVELECVRCLRNVRVPIGDARLFKVAPSESLAERLDAENDEFDALVASERFDVLELVEDEAILALPIAPRHDECGLPAELPADETAAEERPNPFAVLGQLKRTPGSDQGA